MGYRSSPCRTVAVLGTNLTGLEVLHALAQHQAAGKTVVVDGKEVSTGSSIRLQVILIGEQDQLPPQSFPDLQLRAVICLLYTSPSPRDS